MIINKTYPETTIEETVKRIVVAALSVDETEINADEIFTKQ